MRTALRLALDKSSFSESVGQGEEGTWMGVLEDESSDFLCGHRDTYHTFNN